MLDTVPQGSFPSPDYESESGCLGLGSPLSANFEAQIMDPDAMLQVSQSPSDSNEGENLNCLGIGDEFDIFDEESFMPAFDQNDETIAGDILNHLSSGGVNTIPLDKHNRASSEEGDGEDGPEVDFVAIVNRSESRNSDDENVNVDVCNISKSDSVPVERYSLRERQPVRENSEAKSFIIVKRTPKCDATIPRNSPKVVCVQPGVHTVKQPKPANSILTTSNRKMVSPVPSVIEEVSAESDCGKTSAAVQARLNRQKKKVYVEGLENQVKDLKAENGHLRTTSAKLKKDHDSLEEEVQYLRNVLANQSTLSSLLANINNCDGVALTSSFVNDRKRTASDVDHDYGSPAAKRRRPGPSNMPMSGGICLHVDSNQVSMEFCPKCAKMAKEPEP